VLCPTPAPVARPSGIADAAPVTAVPARASSPKTANFNFIWYFLYSKAPVTAYLFLSELELSARLPRYFSMASALWREHHASRGDALPLIG
jgi:hypothetical protein